MATFQFHSYPDAFYIDEGGWIISSISPTQVVLQNGEFEMQFTGSGFAASAEGTLFGTIAGLSISGYDFATGSPVSSLIVEGTGLNHSLSGFGIALSSRDWGGMDFLFNGSDSLNGSAGDDDLVGFGGSDSLVGGDGDDYLDGDYWDSWSPGAIGADTLSGGGGSDWLDGGAGADSMVGGAGDDNYWVEDAGDRVVESAGGGSRDRVEFTNEKGLLSYTLPAQVENLSISHTWTGITPTVMTARGNDLANKISLGMSGDQGYREKLFGMGGNDRLFSGDGNDTLDGGPGNDTMVGGPGSDAYYVDSNLDEVVEDVVPHPASTVVDTVFYVVAKAGSTASLGGVAGSLVNSITFDQIENLSLGKSATTTIQLHGVGSAVANELTGNAAGNELFGLAGNDELDGKGGPDQLFGGSGDDTLAGGAGNDKLSGETGLDRFRFDATLNASTNVDRIIGYVVVDDTIELDHAVFGELTETGILATTAFHKGPAVVMAHDASDRILYDTTTGNLYYDADGDGSAVTAVLFATLGGSPDGLTAADFVVT